MALPEESRFEFGIRRAPRLNFEYNACSVDLSFLRVDMVGNSPRLASDGNKLPHGGISMENNGMGRVLTEVTIENLKDLWAVERGLLSDEQVRRVTVTDALVDTGATLLSLPTKMIRQLGLDKAGSKRATCSTGGGEADVYSAVRLTIQGRSCTMDVMEVPDNVPALVGQIPLEHLDFVVDLRSRTLIGNPAHGGEHVYELY
jgi:predicted aspartyl protease